jgi:hypothetical protein
MLSSGPRLSWVGLVVILASCEGTDPGSTAPPNAPPPPASAADASGGFTIDSGFREDAAMPNDIGTVTDPPDAGAPSTDSGPIDQGFVEIDSGTPDAGALDTGLRDTGAIFPDASVSMDASTPADSGDPAPTVLSPGWIGGPCQSPSDCMYSNATCLTAPGWPSGTCSLACDRLCPDQAGPLNPVTFCIDDGNGDALGACVSRCDFTLSPTGCRAGYVCLPEKRMNQSTNVRYVCVPPSGIPGRAAPAFDIGAACTSASSCNRASCLTDLPGGYCTQERCEIVGCPSGSQCFNIGGTEEYYACLKNCSASGQCRGSDGYVCDTDSTCWPAPLPPGVCNLTGGANDCAPYAAQASRDFVVVTKSLRRMTFCNGSTAVQSFCIGLGASPVLDKEREGDRRTPEGIFYIPRKINPSQFYKAFLISYPDIADAQRGLSQGLITQSEHDAIVAAQNARREPPQHTALGGLIEIHGGGAGTDWTWGCMASDNTTVDYLWTRLDVGETVVIVH